MEILIFNPNTGYAPLFGCILTLLCVGYYAPYEDREASRTQPDRQNAPVLDADNTKRRSRRRRIIRVCFSVLWKAELRDRRIALPMRSIPLGEEIP